GDRRPAGFGLAANFAASAAPTDLRGRSRAVAKLLPRRGIRVPNPAAVLGTCRNSAASRTRALFASPREDGGFFRALPFPSRPVDRDPVLGGWRVLLPILSKADSRLRRAILRLAFVWRLRAIRRAVEYVQALSGSRGASLRREQSWNRGAGHFRLPLWLPGDFLFRKGPGLF